MTTANQNHIDRLMREIVTLRRAEAQETQREADIQAKINRANEAAARTKNILTHRNKLREVERACKNLASVQKKRAEISRKISDKSKNLRSYEERRAREDEKERKRIASEQKRLIRERNQIQRRRNLSPESFSSPHTQEEYDFFISHASEDKDSFVRGLAETLRAKGARVWYDEFALKVGDSLQQGIDRGLANSRFGVIVLSKHFFKKEWAKKELGGLSSLESEGDTRILPIWHEISKDEILRRSPVLGDKVALDTARMSTGEIAERLCERLGQGSPGTGQDDMANEINIYQGRNRTPKTPPPPGSIASSLHHRNYAKHLIDRYHEFKKREIGSGNMNFAIFYKAIGRKFGAKWDYIPLDRFEDLCYYIQNRIDKTIIGKNQKSEGKENYSSFEKYQSKYMKSDPSR